MLKGKVLGTSFKPAKCKALLKLAVSRIKLLRNRREAQLKQLRTDIAHLLEMGQDQTALVQVDHAIKEEKVVAAYEYIEIFCALIVERMAIIESQKHCPTDLKEAIASVIFASPRCADIVELQDVCKSFKAKYGKEFVSAAIELRPDCGVYKSLVEKLSTRLPDGQTKLKTLAAIAEEHEIKWNPKSYCKAVDPPEDSLIAETFSNVLVGNKHNEGMVQTVHIPSQHEEMPDTVVSVRVDAAPPPTGSQRSPTAHVDVSLTFPISRPSGTGTEGAEHKRIYYRDGKIDHRGLQNQKLEFEDATTAAQAAAEAAEQASIAARAAMELSKSGKFKEKLGPDIGDNFSEMNVKEQPGKPARVRPSHGPLHPHSSSQDYDILSTNSYSLVEDDSNVDPTEGTSAVFYEDAALEEEKEDPRFALEKREEIFSYNILSTRRKASVIFEERGGRNFQNKEESNELKMEEDRTSDDKGSSFEEISYDEECSYDQEGMDQKISPRKSIPFFDSESSDSEEDDAKTRVSANRTRIDPTFSRRTKKLIF